MGASNLFQTYLQPPRSVLDYANDYARADQLRNQNALQSLTLQQQSAATQQGLAERNALQRIAAGWTADTTPEARIASLRNSGLPGLMQQADTLETQNLSRIKTGADVAKSYAEVGKIGAETGKISLETMLSDYSNAAKQVLSRPTPEAARTAVLAMAQKYKTDPTEELLSLRGLQTPDQIKQWAAAHALKAEQLLPTIQTRNTGGTTDVLAIDPLTGGAKVTNSVRNTQSPDSVASTAVQMRGQNMVDARERENVNKTMGKAPPGYAWGPVDSATGQQTMIAVKGGPADMKIAGQLNQDTQALTGAVSSFDRLATAANEVLSHPGLKGITGRMGALPNIPGSDAANAEALLGTLKSQVGFGVLQDLRNNSKTGGALGAVSDAEGKRLEANLAALDKSQSIEQFKSNLAKIVDYAEKAKDRMREAYNLKHGSGSVSPAANQPPAMVDSKAAPALPTMSDIDAEIARRRKGK